MALFYAVAGALALATVLMLIWPLIRPIAGGAGAETRDVRDAQIYRDQLDEIEREGVERSWKAWELADLVLEVVDGSVAPGDGCSRTAPDDRPAVRVINKCDLGEHAGWADAPGVRVSCQTGDFNCISVYFGIIQKRRRGGIEINVFKTLFDFFF